MKFYPVLLFLSSLTFFSSLPNPNTAAFPSTRNQTNQLYTSDQHLSLLFWNLRTFGVHRASAEHGQELSKIASSFDILLFAEVKDSECSGIHCPLQTFFQTYFPEHHVLLSPPLHYCNHQNAGSEEYAILIKSNQYEFVHYEDKDCLFIRPPYGIRIHEGGQDYVILLFHSNPGNKNELIALEKVFKQFGNQNILLMGDLNTGCRYVSFDELNHYSIGQNYKWKLDQHVFTNFEKSCPYDRIVSTNDVYDHLDNGRVLNLYREAERIGSDHYPIAVDLYV